MLIFIIKYEAIPDTKIVDIVKSVDRTSVY